MLRRRPIFGSIQKIGCWRFPRNRLEGEVIRDQSLESAGLLNLKMGGPSVFPEIPAGIEGHGWKPSLEEAQRDRRSIYVFVRRNVRYPMFEAFDMPDTHETCARRYNTTTPAAGADADERPS